MNKSKVPIQGVSVNVYDKTNDLVKNTKTNSDGYWEARMPEGRFGIEYLHKNFKPINRTIELKKEDREYEVR